MLEIRVKIDPVSLSVNKHFKNGTIVHPDVQKAQKVVKKATEGAMNLQRPTFSPDSFLKIEFVFTFSTARADLDNPLKRTLDAIADVVGFNDSRVWDIHLKRRIGEPEVWAFIEEMEVGDYLPEGYKPPMQEAEWLVDEWELTSD